MDTGIACVTCRRARPASRGSAFTLIELLVVVAIIGLLVSLLMPSLHKAREQARRSLCATRLHNLGVGVLSYATANKGRIIRCRGGTVQIAMDAKIPGSTNDYEQVDWQKAARRYYIDKELWECPNRPGTFAYEGLHPDMSAADMIALGYTVYPTQRYDQWILGYQYFGGIAQWETSLGFFQGRSPVDESAKGHWALAADANLKVDGRWGGGRPSAYARIPPHPARNGLPAGGNVLSFDGAVAWIPFSRMIPIHSWSPSTRECYWWQWDLGPFGKAWAAQKKPPGRR